MKSPLAVEPLAENVVLNGAEWPPGSSGADGVPPDFAVTDTTLEFGICLCEARAMRSSLTPQAQARNIKPMAQRLQTGVIMLRSPTREKKNQL